jgi:hypothetical protein
MEQPYKGRAIIQDNFNDIEIIIPTRKNWFVILFIGAWLGGWFLGEVFAIAALTGLLGKNFAGGFILFWLVAWTVGGFFALRTFLWNLKGKEIINVGQGRLSIDKKGALLFKSKTYDLNEVKNIRVQEDNFGYGGLFSGRRNDLGVFNSGGTIRFDYGLQTVKFAAGLDEAEGKFIIQKLKDRRLLTEKNYS